MSLYYRLTDERVLDLDPALVASLAPNKRDTLRTYSVDPKPTPTATQVVVPGPIVVDATSARRTWQLANKSAEQLAEEQFTAQQTADYEQIRAIYVALKNGTGTAAERLTRCERVLARLLKDRFGGEPA
jgi:hypothetical protein